MSKAAWWLSDTAKTNATYLAESDAEHMRRTRQPMELRGRGVFAEREAMRAGHEAENVFLTS